MYILNQMVQTFRNYGGNRAARFYMTPEFANDIKQSHLYEFVTDRNSKEV